MKTIILKKTLSERLTNPWEPMGKELANQYLGQLNEFFDSHNKDIEATLDAIEVILGSEKNNQSSNTIFERLILVDKTERIILRLFKGIFEAISDKREIEIRFI